MWRQLKREGVVVARCSVERLMRQMGPRGRVRVGAGERPSRTDGLANDPTLSTGFRGQRPQPAVGGRHHLRGHLVGFRLRRLRHRRVLQDDRRLASQLQPKADLALDALEMAIWSRKDEAFPDLIHHSDHGVQYLSIRYTERLAQVGAAASVGSRGDSYDNAVQPKASSACTKPSSSPRKDRARLVEDVELATLSWVYWWNNHRLHSAIADLPPAEFETAHYAGSHAANPGGRH